MDGLSTTPHSISVRVSVVIPVYNQAKYLAAAIDSVLTQTFRDFEVIAVDDGSTDETPAILARYGPRVRVIRQENRGVASALNRGFAEAHGEWIAILASDDLWEPTKLEHQIQVVESSSKIGLIYTDYLFVDAGGNPLSRAHFPRPTSRRKALVKLFSRCYVNASSALIRRDVLDDVGMHDETLSMAEDWDLWLRIVAKYELGYVPEALVHYRLHGSQTSSNVRLMERSARRVFSRNLRRVGTLLGAHVAVRGAARQLRTFPAFLRESLGYGRTIRSQIADLVEWLVILINPETKWTK